MASLSSRCLAEGVGTLLLVYFGTGAAVITLLLAAGTHPATAFNVGIGQLGGLEVAGDRPRVRDRGRGHDLRSGPGIRGSYQSGGNHRALGDKAIPICGYGCLRHCAVHRCRRRKSPPVLTLGAEAVTVGALGDRTVPGNRVRAGYPCRGNCDLCPDARYHGCRGGPAGNAGICRPYDRAYRGQDDHDGRQHIRVGDQPGPGVRAVLMGRPSAVQTSGRIYPVYVIGPICGAVAAAFFYAGLRQRENI